MKRTLNSLFRRLRSDRRGSVAIPAALFITPLTLLGALIVQVGLLMHAQEALQISANMAALAGASQLTTSTSSAISTASQYSALNPVAGQTPTMVAGYPITKCLTSTGVSCGTSNANAVQVQQQVTLPLILGQLFGVPSKTLTATATAGASGGQGSMVDIMIIVDTTRSMNDSDPSCSVAGATQIGCALAGAQTLLQEFKPTQAYVGLMAFPGVQNATQAGKDYACPGSNPTTVAYDNSPDYLIVGLSNDYKTSDSATTLNPNSNLVKAVGAVSGCGGLQAIGGFGTYYADVITAAQNTLTTTGRSGVQKVIIFLSDGDANATAANVGSAKASNECHQGITAAQAATAAGTWVFTAAYGSPTAVTPGSCSTDTAQPISACTTMQQMASTAAKFFPDTTGGTSSCTSTINPANDIVGIFNAIGAAMTAPRLLLNSTT